MNVVKQKKYELRVAIGLFLIIFTVTSGLKCFSVMMTEISALGFSMAFVGACSSLTGLCSIAFSILFGKLSKTMRLKNMIFIAAILSGLSYIILATSKNSIILAISFILKGVALTFSGYAPAAVLLARWYKQKYSFALAVVFAAMSAGTAFWSMMYGLAQPVFGFQYTLFGLAALQIIIPSLVLKFLIVEKPEDVGLVPYANEIQEQDSTNTKAKKQLSVLNVSSKIALKTALCWHIILVAFIVTGGVLIIQSFLPMQADLLGFTKAQSSSTFSIIMVFGAISGILGGIYANKKSAYHYYAFITFSFLVSWVMLITLDLNYPLLAVIAALSGLAYPVISTAVTLVLKETFGTESYASVLGILNAVNLVGGSIMSPLVGLTYDKTGSYMQAFTLLGSFVLVGFIAMALYPILRKNAFNKYPDFIENN